MATSIGSEATPSSSNGKPSKSGSLQYQGLRANKPSKHGLTKNKGSQSAARSVRSAPTGLSADWNGNPKKMKNMKRPAVAARKAKNLREQGKKRKQESSGMASTPDFARPRKKSRS